MRYQILLLILLLLSIIKLIKSSILIQKRWAYLNITAVSKSDSSLVKTNVIADSALYGTNSPFYPVYGRLIASVSSSAATSQLFNFDTSIVTTISNISSNGSASAANSQQVENPYGCSAYINTNLPTSGDFIALVSRGECTFERKIQIAVESGAAAIIIYNSDQDIFTMLVRNNSIPNVLVQSNVGYLMLNYMKSYDVYVSLKAGPIEIIENNSLPSKASIYFVAIAFLIVLVVTIIWLSVYYVQKYRYYNAKKRLDNRLKKATQKALTKIPVRKLKSDDKEVNETCAICLENYAVNDSIRELPCGHYFHQKDVDLWLVEHRTCPMCKINILQACGIEVNRSHHFFSQYMNFMRMNNRHHQHHHHHHSSNQPAVAAASSATAAANAAAMSSGSDIRYENNNNHKHNHMHMLQTSSSSHQLTTAAPVETADVQPRTTIAAAADNAQALTIRVAAFGDQQQQRQKKQTFEYDDDDDDNNDYSDEDNNNKSGSQSSHPGGLMDSPSSSKRRGRRRRSSTNPIETISEATVKMPLETLKVATTSSSIKTNGNGTNNNNSMKERRAFISETTTSESDSNVNHQSIIKPLKSSENRVFLSENDKSENEFSNIPL